MDDEHEGSVVQRLSRIESKLDRLEDRVERQGIDIIDIKRTDVGTAASIRSIEDWRVEMTVYLKQIRWTFLVALAALIAGVANIVLGLVEHP